MDLRYDWRGDKPPRTLTGETVIYEAHVKGLTLLNPQHRKPSAEPIKRWATRR
ncbi:hypothetical protein LNP74_10565 [Klebsiella pneumoniae subsp. pneumoniae]|nr:hypothetical protein [Klebsiella pneumoniae subsp. pneumoniae]